MDKNKENIVICGHYGASNIGDEAILMAMLQNFKQTHPEANIRVLSYNPCNTEDSHDIKADYLLPLGIRSLFRGLFKGEFIKTLKTIKNCDKFILGGGGLFTDEKIFAVFLWGFHAFVALRYKKPLYMLGQSVGPLRTKIGRWIVKECFPKAKMIYVRDTASKDLLLDLGITNEILVGPDLAFSLKLNREMNTKIDQKGLDGYFLVSLRPWMKNMDILYKNLDQTLDTIVEKYRLLPVLIPFQQIDQNDEDLMHKILDRSRSKFPFLIQKFDQNLDSIIGLIKGSKFTLGMRLHSLILSMNENRPFVALSYSPKVKNLVKNAGFEQLLVENFDFNTILSKVDKVLDPDFSFDTSQSSYISDSKNVILSIFKEL